MLTVVHELVSITLGRLAAPVVHLTCACSMFECIVDQRGLLTAGAQQAQERRPAGLGAAGHCELHVVAAGPPGTPRQCAQSCKPKACALS